MTTQKIILWEKEEYQYPEGYGFIPFLMTYIHDEDEIIRPAVIVVPGGGYSMVTPTEGEIVAKKFYEKGYNTFVCTYTTNILFQTPLKEQPMKDLSRAIRIVRKHAAEFQVNPDQIAVCGFSAGAHLCGSVCVHYRDVEDTKEEYQNISNRPDVSILSYPVITSGEYSHRGSFEYLLGAEASDEELEYMSLEKHVTKDTPPCFLWQTVSDAIVPVENSFLYARACKEAGVPFTHHVFSDGRHGLSLADEDWEVGRFGKPYTQEQDLATYKYITEHQLPVPGHLAELIRLAEEFEKNGDVKPEDRVSDDRQRNGEVAVWPELADAWLRKMFRKLEEE